MSSTLASEVKDIIASEKVVIFSKTYCPYCKLAKEVFDKLKEKYTTVELDLRDDGEQIQGILGEITGARTVPRVFVKGNCLGGGSDVKALYEKGELQALAFDNIGQKYMAVDIDINENGLGHMAILSLLHGVKLTAPAVFVNCNYLGGGSHIKALNEKGQLQTAVQILCE